MTDTTAAQLDPPVRLLMGPGPSLIHPRVLTALSAPTVGHLDPYFIDLMDEVKALLQQLFGTTNALTFPISGTGSAGMEACLANLVEPGDRVVVAQNGVFGGRMADIVGRLGGEVVLTQVPFGEVVAPDQVRAAIAGKPTKLLAVVHAETSTGACQPLPELAAVAHEVDALMLADCVTSLGGIPVELDAWGVDVAYAGTQKCLSCPPGLAPVSFSARAVETIRSRTRKVASWYLDATMLLNYWGGERLYHHTAPVNMIYGLREALRVVLEEGLDAVHARHRLHGHALSTGLEAMGLSIPVAPDVRLPQLTPVMIPEGVDDAALRRRLLREYGIEIGGGLGAFQGKAFRIGLMGHTARKQHVVTFLGALEAVLADSGVAVPRGAALTAAHAVWQAGRSGDE